MKFIRRDDLTPDIRVRIAFEAYLAYLDKDSWGVISYLARKHYVSRQFIYLLIWNLKDIFEQTEVQIKEKLEENNPIFYILLIITLKLQGNCSIGDLSKIFKALHLPDNSTGYISQKLKELALAIPSNTTSPSARVAIVISADETFAGAQPILIIIDSKSHFILKATIAKDRKGETWHHLFEELKHEGYTINYVVKDQGSGLENGARLAGLLEQLDLMHLLKPLMPFLYRFVRQAYRAIIEESERERVFNNARSEATLQKRLDQYEKAVRNANDLINRFDNYAYLWAELIRAFNPFNADGALRRRSQVESEVTTILELMESDIDNTKLKDAIKTFRKAVDAYWGYFDRHEVSIKNLAQQIPEDILRELCLAWQCDKKSRAVKKYARKKALLKQADEHLFLAACNQLTDFETVKQKVFDELEANVRSSSPLESINSIIRDHLNSCRGQITQELLDMIVYFINHKIASTGPYKGTSACQRFTGKKENGNYAEQILQFWQDNRDRKAA